jgi:hypothetical protein
MPLSGRLSFGLPVRRPLLCGLWVRQLTPYIEQMVPHFVPGMGSDSAK